MIIIHKNTDDFKKERSKFSGSVGLVPTMGNLHNGHLSLLERAANENDHVILTIFVNPTQFGPNEDFNSYPRTLEKDIEQVTSLSNKFKDKTFVIFAPKDPKEIYPQGFSTTIQINGITDTLCGKKRPGHFEGVATVVYKLFSLAKAHKAYFGQKDYQQTLVIKKMVQDLDLPVNIVVCPISRNEDGLALSSRNQYLTQQQYPLALNLPKTLDKLENLLKEMTWTESFVKINALLEEQLNSDNWDYLEALDANTLTEVGPYTEEVLLAGAYYVNKTRLIDNRLVKINYA